jgi:flagellar basal body P-ring formation protein FlgA
MAMMKSRVKTLFALIPLLGLLTPLQANAGNMDQAAPARQDLGALERVAERFLQVQSVGLPGKISVESGRIDPRLNLAACTLPEAFLPKGNRAWGKTTVGIRCTAPAAWVVYMSATVRVQGDYYVAAAPLAQGQLVTAGDLSKVSGDLTALPDGIVTDPTQAIGRTVKISMRLGTALRQDGLRSQNVVQQGQTVRVVSNGPGFQITTEARALTNASEGQIAQAKTAAGQVVSGVAKTGGTLEINY